MSISKNQTHLGPERWRFTFCLPVASDDAWRFPFCDPFFVALDEAAAMTLTETGTLRSRSCEP